MISRGSAKGGVRVDENVLFSILQTKFFITDKTVDSMMTEIAEQDPWVSLLAKALKFCL